ncbi:MAG: metallophosphoesterase family protein [Fimbriiglobus sp.]
MRILHTADWHLNDRLGRIDRTDDLRRAVERIAGYCTEHQVDVLLVAGDLFSELARPDALRETIYHWQEVFTKFLTDGGTILTITGNHDNENFCRTLQHAMTLAAPTSGVPGERVQAGRLYLGAEPTFLKLRDRKADFEVQFMLMPFPTTARYFTTEDGKKYSSANEKNRILTQAFNDRHQALRSHPSFQPKTPSVLMAHITMFGSDLNEGLFRLSDTEDIVIHGESLHEQYQYTALGHIHKPQALVHRNVRYSGSIEHLDLGEKLNRCGVVLFDLDEHGTITEPTVLPLTATPIYEVMLLDPKNDIPRLQQEYAEAHEDLVNLHIHYTPGEDRLEEILHELEKIFPRWYARDWTQTNALGEPLNVSDADRSRSFREIVTTYVRGELQNEPDDAKNAMMTLLDEVIQECDPDA